MEKMASNGLSNNSDDLLNDKINDTLNAVANSASSKNVKMTNPWGNVTDVQAMPTTAKSSTTPVTLDNEDRSCLVNCTIECLTKERLNSAPRGLLSTDRQINMHDETTRAERIYNTDPNEEKPLVSLSSFTSANSPESADSAEASNITLSYKDTVHETTEVVNSQLNAKIDNTTETSLVNANIDSLTNCPDLVDKQELTRQHYDNLLSEQNKESLIRNLDHPDVTVAEMDVNNCCKTITSESDSIEISAIKSVDSNKETEEINENSHCARNKLITTHEPYANRNMTHSPIHNSLVPKCQPILPPNYINNAENVVDDMEREESSDINDLSLHFQEQVENCSSLALKTKDNNNTYEGSSVDIASGHVDNTSGHVDNVSGQVELDRRPDELSRECNMENKCKGDDQEYKGINLNSTPLTGEAKKTAADVADAEFSQQNSKEKLAFVANGQKSLPHVLPYETVAPRSIKNIKTSHMSMNSAKSSSDDVGHDVMCESSESKSIASANESSRRHPKIGSGVLPTLVTSKSIDTSQSAPIPTPRKRKTTRPTSAKQLVSLASETKANVAEDAKIKTAMKRDNESNTSNQAANTPNVKPLTRPFSGKADVSRPKTTATWSLRQKNNKVLKDGNVSNTRNNSRRSSANNSSSTTRVVKSETLSKVNSLGITSQRPHSSKVKNVSREVDLSSIQSKIGSKEKFDHQPGGGNVKIENNKIVFSGVKSKIGSLDNAKYTPRGGDKKIETMKVEWKVSSKVGSLDNAKHAPGGGYRKIESKKLDWKVQSKVGSLDNACHVAQGGDKKIEQRKVDWKAQSKVGSFENSHHVPKGGDRKILMEKIKWDADSRVGSLENAQHTPGGGTAKIESHKLDFKERASSRIGSLQISALH